jgi:putative restriction endonuclease
VSPEGRIFGPIAGIPEGATFSTREEVAAAGVHRPLQAGISGSADEGADSIVVSGGYEDDEDYGEELVYTGHGGKDNLSRRQVADQTLTRQNLALAVSSAAGLPVRVVRGAGGEPRYSPSSGYRYDGVFYVESFWKATGMSGFDIYRFRLVRSPAPNPVTNPSPQPPPGKSQHGYATVQRLVRNTAVTQWVKELYGHRCQICGLQLQTAAGPYAEGAHLRPVGRPHNGPDDASNVLCLCPNDHVRLDRGDIGIDGGGSVIQLGSGAVIETLDIAPSHPLDFAHTAYHRSIHER